MPMVYSFLLPKILISTMQQHRSCRITPGYQELEWLPELSSAEKKMEVPYVSESGRRVLTPPDVFDHLVQVQPCGLRWFYTWLLDVQVTDNDPTLMFMWIHNRGRKDSARCTDRFVRSAHRGLIYELFSVKSNLASCSILRANNFHKSIFKNKAKPVPKKSIINVPEVFKEGVQLSLPALVLPSFRVIPDWPLLVASTEGSIGTVLWVLVSRCERPRRRVVDCDHRWCV